ncbi:hypothetical protein D3C81_2261270 [compost metagenome]
MHLGAVETAAEPPESCGNILLRANQKKIRDDGVQHGLHPDTHQDEPPYGEGGASGQHINNQYGNKAGNDGGG